MRSRPVWRVRHSLLPSDDAQAMAEWDRGGCFSVNASVRIAAADHAGRERLLRFCARPPFSLDRLRELDPELLQRHQAQRTGPARAGLGAIVEQELGIEFAQPVQGERWPSAESQ